ncbi:MAG: hypothetical protein U0174_17995 [Polyangiaceae bacterium]
MRISKIFPLLATLFIGSAERVAHADEPTPQAPPPATSTTTPASDAPATQNAQPPSAPLTPPPPPTTPSTESHGAEPPAEKPIKVDLGAGTFFPISFTAEGTVELPYRILVQGDVGWMPSPYSNTIVNLLGAFGVFDPIEEELVKTALKSSFVGRLSAGWRPFPKLGLELLVGYSLVTAGGSLSAREVLGAYLQQKGSGSKIPDDAGKQIPLHTTMHSFHASVGWRFLLLDDHLVLRASLGYLQCLGSNSGIDVTPRSALGQTIINKVNSELSSYLDGYYSTYVKAPIIGVTAAYRF